MFDIIYMSYQESNADENWQKLVDRFPWAQRVHGVKGLVNAHIECAKVSRTSMYWHVEADTIVNDDFNFTYRPDKWNRDVVHVWRAENPVNGLTYGNNGIKLFPTEKVLALEGKIVTDFTTSVSDKFKAVQVVASTGSADTDAYNTWKSAFRECVKLASRAINRQDNIETDKRLDIWCKEAKGTFAEYALNGAKAGRAYGVANSNKPDNLRKINDFDWLKEQFNAR